MADTNMNNQEETQPTQVVQVNAAWLEELTQRLEASNQIQTQQTQQIMQLQSQLKKQLKQSPANSSPLPQYPRARLPDPAKFNGDRLAWPSWKVAIENKIRIDQAALGDELTTFFYIYSRLEGNAEKSVATYVRMHQGDGTAEGFLGHLDKLFGDPNAAARAARRLHQLKQGERQSFAKFLPIFEKDFADAGAAGWADESKKQLLLNALNKTLSMALVNRGIPETFEQLVSRLHEISADLDMLAFKNGQISSVPATDAMDWTPSHTKTYATRTAPNPEGYPSKRPEDQNLLGKRAKWVEKEELEKRRHTSRCLRCGRTGCFVIKCPLKPALRPGSQTNTPRAVVTTAAYEEDTEDVEIAKSEKV